MKQIFILLMVAMYATMFTACSKDNETPSPLNSDKEVLTIVVEEETFSFQIESPQLGIIHDDMYYIEKNILMHKRGNTLLQSRTSTI